LNERTDIHHLNQKRLPISRKPFHNVLIRKNKQCFIFRCSFLLLGTETPEHPEGTFDSLSALLEATTGISILDSRFSALFSRLSSLGSLLSALDSRLSALDSQLSNPTTTSYRLLFCHSHSLVFRY
jgi:hypothetical protein